MTALCRLQVHEGNVVSADRVFMTAKQLRGFYQGDALSVPLEGSDRGGPIKQREAPSI